MINITAINDERWVEAQRSGLAKKCFGTIDPVTDFNALFVGNIRVFPLVKCWLKETGQFYLDDLHYIDQSEAQTHLRYCLSDHLYNGFLKEYVDFKKHMLRKNRDQIEQQLHLSESLYALQACLLHWDVLTKSGIKEELPIIVSA